MKSYIWLETADGSIQEVEEEVAMFCPVICRELLQNGKGSSKNCAILLPERVNPANLELILEFCRFHQVPGRSNKVSFLLLLKQCIPPPPPPKKNNNLIHIMKENQGLVWLCNMMFNHLASTKCNSCHLHT